MRRPYSRESFIALLLSILIVIPSALSAQIGGNSTYQFLNLSSAARIGAMGGKLVPVKDDDLNLVLQIRPFSTAP